MTKIDNRRDPLAVSRLSMTLLIVLLAWPVLKGAEFNPGALFGAENLKVIGRFLAAFLPPQTGAEFLSELFKASLQTLAIATTGMVLALLVAVPLAYRVSRVCRSHPGLQLITRGLLTVLRGIPELVWATLTVLAVGLGPFAGALALALHTTGVLGRLFAQAIDNATRAPTLALQHAGASRSLDFVYATLPQIAPQLVAYTLYRWEMNIRMAAILGFVGAGGLGQLLYVALSLMDYPLACTLIMAMLLLSMLVDQASALLRRCMA